MSERIGIEALQSELDVSRETMERLERFAQLLTKWNKKINLVGKSTLSEIWTRHILDSAQVCSQFPDKAEQLADLGSGGGFPGIVLAILAADSAPERRTILVEADSRKAAFLRTAARELGLKAIVANERIESLMPLNADVVTARAVAPLPLLLCYADRHLAPAGTAIFLKGENYQGEVDDALASWRFSREVTPSLTANGAVILKIGEITRV